MNSRRQLLLALLLLSWGSASVFSQTQPPEDGPRKLALLVGVQNYWWKEFDDLSGCWADVADMRNLLIEEFRFQAQDILCLTDEEESKLPQIPFDEHEPPLARSENTPSRQRILNAFREHLIAGAKKEKDDHKREAIVVFYFSGHGSQILDRNGDEDGDRYDETLVVWDSGRKHDNLAFDIRDDEISELLAELNQYTSNVHFVLDSCHSGTGTRHVGKTEKAIASDDRTPPEPETQRREQRESTGVGKCVLLSGCRYDQSSFEIEVDEGKRGALTHALTQAVSAHEPGLTYADLEVRIKSMVGKWNDAQQPTIEGEGEVFGFIKSTGMRSFVPVNPYVNDETYGLRPLKHDDPSVAPNQTWLLMAGRIHGVTKGSDYDIYPPGTEEEAYESLEGRIGRIEILDVQDLYSTFKFRGTWDSPETWKKLQPASQAVLRIYELELDQFPIFLDFEDKDLLTRILEKSHPRTGKNAEILGPIPPLNQRNNFRFVDKPEKARITLEQRGEEVRVLDSLGMERQGTFATGDNAAEDTHRQLDHWAKWHHFKHLENPGEALVELSMLDASGNSRSSFRVGEEATLQIENTRRNNRGKLKKIYFVLLLLTPDGAVRVAYPQLNRNETKALEVEVLQLKMAAFVPKRHVGTEAETTFRVICSDEAFSCGFIEQTSADSIVVEPPRRQAGKSLVSILQQITGHQPIESRGLERAKWDTAAVTVDITGIPQTQP